MADLRLGPQQVELLRALRAAAIDGPGYVPLRELPGPTPSKALDRVRGPAKRGLVAWVYGGRAECFAPLYTITGLGLVALRRVEEQAPGVSRSEVLDAAWQAIDDALGKAREEQGAASEDTRAAWAHEVECLEAAVELVEGMRG